MANQPDIIKIRIFGSKNCEECSKQIKAFDMHLMEYEFLDADATENEKLCDAQRVDRIPHTQAFYASSKKVIANRIGFVPPAVFMAKIADALAQDRQDNMSIKGVRQGANGFIETKTKEVNCSGCKNNGKKTD